MTGAVTLESFIEEMTNRLSSRLGRLARKLGLINERQEIKVTVKCVRRTQVPVDWSEEMEKEITNFSGWKESYRPHDQAQKIVCVLAAAYNQPIHIPDVTGTDVGDCNQYLRMIGFPYDIVRVSGSVNYSFKSTKERSICTYQLWRRI